MDELDHVVFIVDHVVFIVCHVVFIVDHVVLIVCHVVLRVVTEEGIGKINLPITRVDDDTTEIVV